VCLPAGGGGGGGHGGDHLESDGAGPDVQTFVSVPVNGPTPAGNCFQLT